MAERETAFMTNPIEFLKAYVLSPPDGSAGNVLHQWDVTNQGNILEGMSGPTTSSIRVKTAGVAKQFATFVAHPLFPGCLTLRLSPVVPNPAPRPVLRSAVPMWWLPWESLALTKLRIPPVPGSLVDPDEADFPRFFATAGINGCTVMVQGPSDSPTIFHAGITGKLARRADEFWLEQLREAQNRMGTAGKVLTGIHKYDYMGDRPALQRFEAWKNSSKPGGFKLEIAASFGSVVGVRYGRHWSLYLQQNVFTQDVEILKRSDVESHGSGKGKYYTDHAGARVERVDHKTPRMLGGMKFGESTVKTFLRRTNATTSVVAVGEIYPTRTFAVELATQIRPMG